VASDNTMPSRGRDLAGFERVTGLRPDAVSQVLPNASHATYWLIYPITLLECVAMALVSALSYLLLRVTYFKWWHPETARVRPPSRAKKSINTEAALRAMQTIESIARETQAQVFWISGTLLGLERIGQPLPHDNDLDLGICVADSHCHDLIRALWASDRIAEIAPQTISRKTRHQNPDLQHVSNRIIRYKAGVRSEDGSGLAPIKIDIFLHFPYRGGLMHGSRNSLWWNSPLCVMQKRYGSRMFSVPEDAHRYLVENYGEYQTEVKEFENSIDCPNAMNIFSWRSLGYLLSRLQLMLKLGRVKRAHQIIRRISVTIRKGMYPFSGRTPRQQP
jgi:hypothetical protein